MSVSVDSTQAPAYKAKFVVDMINNKLPTSRQEVTMEIIARAHEDDGAAFVAGMPFPNFSDGDGIGPSTGQVLLFKPDAKVRACDFGEEVFGMTCMSPIDDMKGVSVHQLLHGLEESTRTYAPVPVAASLECTNPGKRGDAREWLPELGPTGRAGILRHTDGRKTSHYLVVHASPGLVNEQLKQYVRNNPDLTYKELQRDPFFNYAREITRRNALRVFADVRSGLRLKVGGSIHRDHASVVAEHELPPNLFQPVVQHYTSSIEPLIYDGQEHVAVYNSVVPAKYCKSSIVVDQGPWDGYLVFDTRTSRPTIGLPSGSRVLQHPSGVQVTDEHKALVDDRSSFFTWTNKSVGAPFPTVLLDGIHDTAHQGSHLMELMKAMGLRATTPVATLLPIAMKVASTEECRAKN